MKKIRMTICAAGERELAGYENLCQRLCNQRDILMEYKTYTSGKALSFDLENPLFCKKLDVIFFVLCEENTKDLVSSFRKSGYKGLIILVGDVYDNLSAEELFDYHIFNAVKSNKEIERFSQVFEKAIDASFKAREEKIVVSYGGELRYIDLSEILYFEKKDRGLVVYYNEESFFFISTMAKLEQQLKGRNFCRASASHLVSLEAVDKVVRSGRDYTVVVRDGAEIPVGRKYAVSFRSVIRQEAF